MKKLVEITKGFGKVMLAILTAVLMPILIWVGLGVAINRKMQEKRVREAAAPTIGEALGKAKITIHR